MTTILCTDLDRTLLPNGLQPFDTHAIQILSELHESKRLILIYVSGRDKRLIKSAIQEHQLPLPDYAIADVGARIYDIVNGKWHKDEDWKRYLALNWSDKAFKKVQTALAQMGALRLQEPEHQSRFKMSFYTSPDVLETDIDASIQSICSMHGITARVIKSLDETSHTGLIDVLPENASKYHAIRFLMDKHQFNSADVVFAGDSGNDLEVLTSELPAVLVKNAHPSVRAKALQITEANQQQDRLYLAQGGFCGLNGNYCSGILEGLAHYHADLRYWMESHLKC